MGEVLQKEMSLDEYLTEVDEALQSGHHSDYLEEALINIERNLASLDLDEDIYELMLSYKRRLIYKLYSGTRMRHALAY